MQTKKMTTLFGVTLLLAAMGVHAEPLDVKPGLWESTFTTDISGMPIPSNVLNNLTPEKRARLEAAMKARQANGPRNNTEKTCLTKEDLNRPFDKQDDADQHCTNTIVSVTRTRAEYKIACTGANPHNGTMHVEALSRERVKATMKMNAGNGAVSSEMTSKWIAADCGNVK